MLSEIQRWSNFIEKEQTAKQIPKPFPMVEKLVNTYLKGEKKYSPVLDVGCETGKNAICLIKAGLKVVLLDIAPNAVSYTTKNLEEINLSYGIEDSIVGKIEDIKAKNSFYKAVVGTYVFSFIPPHLFEEVMTKKVLGQIETGGYFVGGFFGKKHAWSKNPHLSIMNLKKISNLFSLNRFVIIEIIENKEETKTQQGTSFFHTLHVIARRI